MKRFRHRIHILVIALTASIAADRSAAEGPQDARALIERHEKEKFPVWADGDTATFFHRGEAEQVLLLVAGDSKLMTRLHDSDLWTATYTKPGLAREMFTFAIVPGKKGESLYGRKLQMQSWRGPQAPPPVARLKREEIKGTVRTVAFDSKALGAKRDVHVYWPPGHDPKKAHPVLYGTDGQDVGSFVEPLIAVGKLPPMVVVAAASGGYLGERAAPGSKEDMERDVRSMEYIPGDNTERHTRHEQSFARSSWRGPSASSARRATACSEA